MEQIRRQAFVEAAKPLVPEIVRRRRRRREGGKRMKTKRNTVREPLKKKLV